MSDARVTYSPQALCTCMISAPWPNLNVDCRSAMRFELVIRKCSSDLPSVCAFASLDVDSVCASVASCTNVSWLVVKVGSQRWHVMSHMSIHTRYAVH